jgi:hypothetical protein
MPGENKPETRREISDIHGNAMMDCQANKEFEALRHLKENTFVHVLHKNMTSVFFLGISLQQCKWIANR